MQETDVNATTAEQATTVLVVEDDEGLNHLIRKTLAREGYKTCQALTGAEALHFLAKDSNVILLLDYILPDINGKQVVQAIKEGNMEVPMIIMTGYGDESIAIDMMKMGVRDYIIKKSGYIENLPNILKRVEKEIDSEKKLARAEKELRESERRLKEAQKIARVGDWEFDIASQKLIWSEQVYRMYERDPALGPPTPEEEAAYYTTEQAALLRQYARQTIETGKNVEYEFTASLAGGKTPVFAGSMRPVKNDVGKVIKLFGTLQDITERRQAEESRIKADTQLHQAQKMEVVGLLAGGVAHDFNNMLSIIIGFAGLAMSKLKPSDPALADIQHIMKAGQSSADIVRQLLAFARKQTISPKTLDLNETVTSILKMLGHLIGEDIELTWTPGHGIGKVRMDPSQVDQILANLSVNARDAIAGVGKIVIGTCNAEFNEDDCRAHDGCIPGRYVMLSFSDNGCGIDKETLARVFEPFFTTKELGKGTGLGLSVVYGIVKQNNGFIDVYSEKENGTTFKIYLPCQEAEKAETLEKRTESEVLTGSETVLLVEDDDEILELEKESLTNLGYTVLTADSPSRAIELAAEYAGDIHLLMTDVVMPEMNGRDLLQRINALRPEVKCLFVSGYTADVIAHRGVIEEGIHFLQKPFTIEPLSVKLREALSAQ